MSTLTSGGRVDEAPTACAQGGLGRPPAPTFPKVTLLSLIFVWQRYGFNGVCDNAERMWLQ